MEKGKDKMETFPDEYKLKEFVASKPKLQDMIEEFLQFENK